MSDNILHKTKITTNLGTFEFEGSQEFVENQIEKIVNIAKSNNQRIPQTPVSPLNSKDTATKKTSTRKISTEQPQMLPNLITDKAKIDDLRSFYELKKSENHIENFAVLALWLKTNNQILEVSISEMWTLYKILGIKPPKVIIQVFRDGKSKKAYFEVSETAGRYYLTPFGETFVEHDLPRKLPSK